MRFDEFVVEYLDKFPDGENPYDYLSTYSTQEIIDLYIESGKKQMKIVYDEDTLDGGTIVFLNEVKS
jgi:hypothetical protein